MPDVRVPPHRNIRAAGPKRPGGSPPYLAIQMMQQLAWYRTLVQAHHMHDDQWVWPERRDLHRACLTLANPQASSASVSEAADILLNDLELYDDPRQGKDLWLFPDESPVADNLVTKLHALAGAETSGDWGDAIIGQTTWPGICADAQKLLGMIRRNGQGTAQKVR